MLADSPHSVISINNGSTPRGVFSAFDCCIKKNNTHITLPVFDPTLYGHELARKSAELQHSQYLATQPLLKSPNLELTEEDSELFNQNMLLGFNNRFNSHKNALEKEISGTFELEENLFNEELQENNLFSDSKNEETSSNINELFEDVSTVEENKKFCNLLGNCFSSQNIQSSDINEVRNLSGGMNSLVDPPDFVDLDTLNNRKSQGIFSRCLRPLDSNHLDKFSSIISQASLVPSDVGCFNTCSKKFKKYVDVDKFTTLATTSSLGLRNLYKSISQNNILTSTQSFFESLPSTMIQESNTFTKFFSFEEEPSCFNFKGFNDCFKVESNHLFSYMNGSIMNTGRSNEQINERITSRQMFQTNKRTKLKNSGPNTFRLHAVEIHQYVPFPNLPSSRFVAEGGHSNHFSNDYFENCFFNPNATGLAAPMIPNLINGSKAIPEVYSLKSKVNRLSTQDLSMCVFPSDPTEVLPDLRLVE